MREKQIQRDIIRALRSLGFQVDDMSQPRASMMPVGLPDLRVRHIHWKIRGWMEVKTPNGRVTPGQEQWHETERMAGGTVAVVHSVEEALATVAEWGAPIEV
ncbi:MAG: VRR-NUC domain-containing protein [Bacteroidota bacterium]